MGTKTSQRLPYTRNRARISSSILLGTSQQRIVRTDNGTTSSGSYNQGTAVCQETMTDVVSPGFSQRKAKGEIVLAPMVRVKPMHLALGDDGFAGVLQLNPGTATWTWDKNSISGMHGVLSAPRGVTKINRPNLINLTQTEALSKAGQANLQTGVFFGEMGKTIFMLMRPGRALMSLHKKLERDYLKGNFSAIAKARLRVGSQRWGAATNDKGRRLALREVNAARRLLIRSTTDKRQRDALTKVFSFGDILADGVLTVNLGVKPLLMDIEQILDKIPNKVAPGRSTSRAMRTLTQQWDEIVTTANAYTGGATTLKHTYEETLTVRCGVIATDNFDARRDFGLRLQDLPETAWELIPFSFLVDYVANVESYLGALRAQAYSDILGYFTTVKLNTKKTRECTGLTFGFGYVTTKLPKGVEIATYEEVARSVDEFPVNLAWKPYGLQRPAAQAQNVFALLTNALLSYRNSAGGVNKGRF